MSWLDPPADDKDRTRQFVIWLLSTTRHALRADRLAAVLVRLDPTAEDDQKARQALLAMMATAQLDPGWLHRMVAWLTMPAADKRQGRQTVIDELVGHMPWDEVARLGWAAAWLDTAPDHVDHVRHALLRRLENGCAEATWTAWAAASLRPTAEEKQRARQALLEQLSSESNRYKAADLAAALAELDPTVNDLRAWAAGAFPPDADVLAAVRRNSTLDEWLAVLPALPSPA
jgi:hypothetical protein